MNDNDLEDELLDALRAEPSRSSPDPDRLRLAIEAVTTAVCAKNKDGQHGPICGHPFYTTDDGFAPLVAAEYSRLGSSPDLTGLDPD